MHSNESPFKIFAEFLRSALVGSAFLAAIALCVFLSRYVGIASVAMAAIAAGAFAGCRSRPVLALAYNIPVTIAAAVGGLLGRRFLEWDAAPAPRVLHRL